MQRSEQGSGAWLVDHGHSMDYMEKLLGHPATAPTQDELVASLVPPKNFAHASFASYRPDPKFPAQQHAKDTLIDFVDQRSRPAPSRWHLRREASTDAPIGWYLDGGFGVGKTHLLAATFHAWEGVKYYVSFSGLTSLVGALTFGGARELLAEATLVAIDEFELDDPGDTVLISRLCEELMAAGSNLVVTSNTLPTRLGEGRFAAQDFLREIQGLAASFQVLTIEGGDFRRRAFRFDTPVDDPKPLGSEAVVVALSTLCDELSHVHPIRYRGVVRELGGVEIVDAQPIKNQVDALRLCSLVDVLYDFGVPVRIRGISLDELFPPSFLAGGFRQKYGRCLSRLFELATVSELAEGDPEGSTRPTEGTRHD